MMQKKKNGFLLFCFSFMPGAGEMYMGFMKMGLSLMGVFLAMVCIVSIIGVPELSVAPALIYFYSFFHAHNIASLDDERFYNLEDNYLFGMENLEGAKNLLKGKYKKWLPIGLIIIGIVMLWNAGLEILWDYCGKDNYIVKALYNISDYAPRIIIGLAIIIAGIRLIFGKKKEDTVNLIEDKKEE